MEIYVFQHFVSEKIKGLNNVWLLGDNFIAASYRKFFLQRPEVIEREVFDQDFFIKNNYDFYNYCNSKYSSATKNILTRLQNTFASAINKNISLPKYMIVILDNDLIDFLDFYDPGQAEILGHWLQWLLTEMKNLIAARLKQLPEKAKRNHEPCVYWTLVPMHINFSQKENDARKRFNLCLASLLKGCSDMRAITLKEKWNFYEALLVKMNKITDQGLYVYWEAIDAAFKFNVHRHELYLAKLASNQFKKEEDTAGKSDGCAATSKEDRRIHQRLGKPTTTGQDTRFQPRDEMQRFFQKHKNKDRFHWNANSRDRGNRFLLPRTLRK